METPPLSGVRDISPRFSQFPLHVRIPRGTCGLTHDSDLLIDQVLACWRIEMSKPLDRGTRLTGRLIES
jgi:hypothetical protein